MSATSRSGGDRVANGIDAFPKDGLPSRPMDLTKEQNEIWTTLMSQIPNELLRRVDVHNLKTMVQLIAKRDELGKQMFSDSDLRIVSKYLNIAQAITRLSSQYGLSPIDRRRMKLEQPEEEDDIADWEDGN
jgi:phage terminase small subunit